MPQAPKSKAILAGALLLVTASVGLWISKEDPSNPGEITTQPETSNQPSTLNAPASLPAMEAAADTKNDPSTVTPQHAIANERVLTFSNEADYRAFLASHNGAIKVIAQNDTLKSIRIRYSDNAPKNGLPSSAQADFNYTLLTPLPITELPALDKAFRGTALDFMSVPESSKAAGEGVTVAILDTGIREHSTLDQIDVERYGYNAPTEYLPHGTAVASLIAGQEGVGIAPKAKLIGIQVLDTDGIGDAYSLAEGIVQAVDSGANIINMSLGSYGSNQALSNAVAYANNKGVVLVASAGNESVTALPYPAAYPTVIAVAAIDANGHPTSFSNQSQEVDMAAPGVGVYAAWEDDKWVSFTGTSASAPYVSGAIAALSSELNIPATEAANLLLANANDSGLPGNDPQLGRGYINLSRSYDSRTTYTDLALSDIYLDPFANENGQNTVHITAQNRGTQTIPTASINYTLPNGITQNIYLGSLEPGQTAAHTLTVGKAELETGYRISAQVESNNDSINHNDSKETRIAIPVETPNP